MPKRLKKINKIKKFKGTTTAGVRQVKRRTTGEFKARQKLRGRKIEVVSNVVSPRGRAVRPTGVYDPTSKVAMGMPLSAQDYFMLSRAIANTSYDRGKMILEIEFTSGGIYQYSRVSQTLWEGFKTSASKGRFFHNYIYGYWTGKKGNKIYHPRFNERRIK